MCERYDIYGNDVNKLTKPKVPEMGGVPVMTVYLAVLAVAIGVLWLRGELGNFSIWQLGSIFVGLVGVALVGFVDDWYGLRQVYKAMLPIPFLLPFAALFPIEIDLFSIVWVFPAFIQFLLVAFMVDAGANASNMLEGYNGMGAGVGILMSLPIIVFSIAFDEPLCLLMATLFLFASLAFYSYNRYPARIFPGDVLTLSQGALLAMVPIMGGFEEIGALVFLPMIVNGVMTVSQLKTKYSKFGYRNRFGIIRYSRNVIALPHFLAKRYQLNEQQITSSIFGIQFFVSLLAVVIIIIIQS